MAQLIFYGASDDLIEVEGVFEEEYPAEKGTFLVVAGDGRQAKVRVTYENEGCWSVATWPVDDDIAGFESRVEFDRYSARLILDVPEQTKVHPLDGLTNGCE